MGPKVKKAAKNGFWFFIDDYVQEERSRGRLISHRIAAEESALLWRELPIEKKNEYNQLAAFHKQPSKQEKEIKFLSTGISYAQFEQEEKELKQKNEREDIEIKNTISNLDSCSLKTHLFYIIHCNYYCKTKEGVYVPGELAIVEFNLKDGIRRTFHSLINPGSLPLGYAFEAKKRIDEVHGLPYPPFEEGDSDYFSILDKIVHFLEPGKLPDGQNPPLYTIETNIKPCESILRALIENHVEDDSFFRVYLLSKMFFWLKNKCVEGLNDENVGFPVVSNAESEISKDLFCYVPGISCIYHLTSDETYQNCSLSVVQRYVYVVCDHCCQYVGVELIPGKHCRLLTDTERKPVPVKKIREPQAVNEMLGSEYGAASSFGGDFGSGKWNSTGKVYSFLHEEIESNLYGVEVLSIDSRSTKVAPSVSTACGVKEEDEDEEDEDSDEEDFFKSVGRGTSWR